MEVIIALLLLVVKIVTGNAFHRAQNGGHSPTTRRTPARLPRRQFGDVIGKLNQAQAAQDAPAATYASPVSYAPRADLAEGESRRDALGCVGGTLVHDLHEGEEFPGHVHANAAPLAVSEPLAAIELVAASQDLSDIRARLIGGQARYAMVVSEVLGRPVSMRRKGGCRP